MVGKKCDSQILVNFHVTHISRCTICDVKTFDFQHFLFPDMDVSSEPLDGACIVHHRTDELLTMQHTVSDGQATFSNQMGM